MPNFDSKTEKFKLFEDLIETSLKIHNQLTEVEKMNYCHSLMRDDALQTFKNITSPNRRDFSFLFLLLQRRTDLREQFNTVQNDFDNFCASYNTVAIGPKKSLETNFSKKGYPLGDKTFESVFSFNIDYGRQPVTFFTQGSLAIMVQVIRSFL